MDLFVYGTLRSQKLMAAVAGGTVRCAVPAELSGYGVFPVDGNVVPFIAPQSGATAQGLVYEDLDDQQIARLDLYEGAFGYRVATVDVATAAGPRTVQCYLPPDGAAPGVGAWSLDVWEADHLAPAVLAATELFSYDPLPSFAAARGMWPMIEARAWSKHRAKAAPATRRFVPEPADFQITGARTPQGRFFRFESVDVRHRKFTGGQSDVLVREGFIGTDAAVVLPYDPVRDKVLLVEQARLGPRLRHDANPWMLEPVAGIVDARETPQAAALRECKEEAGVVVTRLEEAGAFYVSPGASTDYFYTYVGLCDLPQTEAYLGGLDDEAEDLRLHPMAFDDALALADSGEIATGPALFLLYWILRHKARLQGAA
ncbi:nudix-type nucleoside diphosphatase (YffH/AdpP family) [Loktanella sp. PT4BL]|jgi:nudix-type nucleoside diphosphatase (YffH/AdpP family)|uniref:NUDIX domain-containing protein n=1 Tax=Loktanella sp. PT4BL TaxID=2135611 RepID=UPI000D7680F8|nr:gamma-glutamylcyclotransferase [Loktanella sp. PT4BL]PXW70498.1 nudix-type nucleoside diphosphatase (YffH/AdpP family) [Loktanella sp. PT4BL]